MNNTILRRAALNWKVIQRTFVSERTRLGVKSQQALRDSKLVTCLLTLTRKGYGSPRLRDSRGLPCRLWHPRARSFSDTPFACSWARLRLWHKHQTRWKPAALTASSPGPGLEQEGNHHQSSFLLPPAESTDLEELRQDVPDTACGKELASLHLAKLEVKWSSKELAGVSSFMGKVLEGARTG